MAARKKPTTRKKAPAKKPQSKARPTSKKGGSKAAGRIDNLVKVQKAAIKHVSEFVSNVSALTAKGDFAPDKWLKHYGDLLSDLSEDLANTTKAFLND